MGGKRKEESRDGGMKERKGGKGGEEGKREGGKEG